VGEQLRTYYTFNSYIMKFFAWFLAVIIFFSVLLMVNVYNFHQTFFNPAATKKALSETDFYPQMKSVLKKSLFESEEGNSPQVAELSRTLGTTFDEYNFQPKVENIIDDFYLGLKDKNGFSLSIDLREYKTIIQQKVADQTDIDSSELTDVPVPDEWKVDVSKYAEFLSVVGFVYRNFAIICIAYLALIVFFALFCILINYKYLRLFFVVSLVTGILILIEYFVFKVASPKYLLSAITDQGNSGVEVATANFLEYFRANNLNFLFWESISTILASIIGLIIISVIPSKTSNIPLVDHK